MNVTARMTPLCDHSQDASRGNPGRSRGLSIEREDMETLEINHAHPAVGHIPAGCLVRLPETAIVAARERPTAGGVERRLNAAQGLSLREQGLATTPGPRFVEMTIRGELISLWPLITSFLHGGSSTCMSRIFDQLLL